MGSRRELHAHSLDSPLDSKEIQTVNPTGNQSWIFTGKTSAEAEALILWPPDSKSRLTGKNPDAGKVWRQKEEGATHGWMTSLTQWMSLSKLQEIVKDRGAWRSTVHGVTKSQTWLSNWTTPFPLPSPSPFPISAPSLPGAASGEQGEAGKRSTRSETLI